jgi:hypothetical protein
MIAERRQKGQFARVSILWFTVGMPKRKTYTASSSKSSARDLHLSIDVRALDRKIRKSQPPTVKTHRSANVYRRKPKHPNRNDE